MCCCDASLFEVQAFASVKSVANVFYVVGNGLSTFVAVFQTFLFFRQQYTLHAQRASSPLCCCDASLFEVQAFASVKSVANVFYVVGNGLSTFVAVFQTFLFFRQQYTLHAQRASSPLCCCDASLFEVQAFASVKSVANVFTSQLIVGNIVVGQKPRYSTPTSSISFILGLEILYFKILPSLSQETTSMSRKIRNWWETVV